MGIFAPFSFLEQKDEVLPAWSPEDFANVQYWWRADSGVTTAGTGVSQWRDQINNFDMIQGTDANRPSVTTSANLNGADVISFNGTTDYLYTTSAPAALSSRDVTMLAVWDMVDDRTGGSVMGVTYFGNGNRFWSDTSGGNYRSVHQGFGTSGVTTTNIASSASPGANTLKLRYDASSGDAFYALNTLTETASGTSGNTNVNWDANSTVCVGAAVQNNGGTVFSGRYVEYKLAEQVFVYGTPSAGEMSNWESYVNSRYGTIIS